MNPSMFTTVLWVVLCVGLGIAAYVIFRRMMDTRESILINSLAGAASWLLGTFSWCMAIIFCNWGMHHGYVELNEGYYQVMISGTLILGLFNAGAIRVLNSKY